MVEDKGWIEWNGEGHAPDPATIRKIKLRDGTITDNLMMGWWSRFEWARPTDIIAYRIINEES